MICIKFNIVSIECGLPPNTKVKIELDKQSNEFLIMKQTGDPEKYELKITNIALYIPVGQLSAAGFWVFPDFGDPDSGVLQFFIFF